MKAIYDIVGMKYHCAEPFVRGLPNGTPVTLEREPTNVVDQNAIKVIIQGRHVGYVKSAQAGLLAPIIDKTGRTTMQGTLVASRYPSVEVEE